MHVVDSLINGNCLHLSSGNETANHRIDGKRMTNSDSEKKITADSHLNN
jgi:hypothetical protein